VIAVRVAGGSPRWRRRVGLGALAIVAIASIGLGTGLPFALSFADSIHTPYRLPAHHAVFVHTMSSSTECLVTEGGIDTERIWIDRAEPIPFTGYRLAPRAFDDAVLRCTDSVIVSVDPDWRYDFANNQPAKVSLTLLGLVALAVIRVATKRRRERDGLAKLFVRGAG
jgi:hypothetical protein